MNNPIVETSEFDQMRSDIVALTPKLRSFAQSLCRRRHDAEDLVQDTLCKAWERRSQYQAGTALGAWMSTIMRNRFLGNRRRDWRSQPLDPKVAENTLLAVSDPDKRLELDEMRRALARLSVEQREAVMLVGAGGFGYGAAAEIVNTNIGTLKSRTSRGRARLHEILATGDFGMDNLRCEDAMPDIMAQVARICARGGASKRASA